MSAAVVMAGGEGTRMRASGAVQPKPLVPLLGLPLVERAVRLLGRHGFDPIRVVVPRHSPALQDWLHTRAPALSRALGCTVEGIVERRPLGNLGGVGPATHDLPNGPVLVWFADNVSDMDLTALLDHHTRRAADLTLAVHTHPTPIPYGVLTLQGPQVVAYDEKPTLTHEVSSGTYVLSAAARRDLSPDTPTSASELVTARLAAGHAVHAWSHRAHWLDVNTTGHQARAEALIRAHPQAFEVLHRAPDDHLVLGDPARHPTLDHIDDQGQVLRVVPHPHKPPPADLDRSLARRLAAWSRS